MQVRAFVAGGGKLQSHEWVRKPWADHSASQWIHHGGESGHWGTKKKNKETYTAQACSRSKSRRQNMLVLNDGDPAARKEKCSVACEFQICAIVRTEKGLCKTGVNRRSK